MPEERRLRDYDGLAIHLRNLQLPFTRILSGRQIDFRRFADTCVRYGYIV